MADHQGRQTAGQKALDGERAAEHALEYVERTVWTMPVLEAHVMSSVSQLQAGAINGFYHQAPRHTTPADLARSTA